MPSADGSNLSPGPGSVGARVKRARYLRGHSVRMLAKLSGVSRTAIYQLEAGRARHSTAGTVGRIAAALGLPVDELIGGDPPAEPSPAEEIAGKFRALLGLPIAGPVRGLVEIAYELARTDARSGVDFGG